MQRRNPCLLPFRDSDLIILIFLVHAQLPLDSLTGPSPSCSSDVIIMLEAHTHAQLPPDRLTGP